MSKKWKIATSIALVTALTLGCFYGTPFKKDKATVAEAASTDYFVGDDGKIVVPARDSSKSVGTAENPFFVLEIVPNDQEAFFGYQIDGCAPIDLEKWSFYIGTDKSLPDNDKFIKKTASEARGYFEMEDEYKKLTDGVPEDYLTSKGFLQELPCLGTVVYTPGTGNYKIEGTGDAAKLVYVEAGGQDYSFTPEKVADVVNWKNDSNKMAEYSTVATTSSPYKYNMGNKKAIYSTKCVTLEHQNLFLKYSVGLAYKKNSSGVITNPDGTIAAADLESVNNKIANYHSIVYTVTPQELNNNLALVDRADMVVISTKCDAQNSGDIPSWMYKNKYSETYINSLGSNNKNVANATFKNGSNTLTWAAVKAIYNRVSDFTNKCPIIIDNKTYQDAYTEAGNGGNYEVTFADGQKQTISLSKASNNTMYKLILLLTEMKGSVFKQLFGTTSGSVLDGANFDDTGKFKGKDKWSPEMFYPYEMINKSDCMNGSTFERNNLEDICDTNEIMHTQSSGNFLVGGAQDFVIGNGYKFNGGVQMREKFYFKATAENTVITRTDGLGAEVFEFWDKAIGGTMAGVDVSNILYYILHYDDEMNPNRPIVGDLRVLDIEPTAYFPSKVNLEEKIELMLALSANFSGNVTVDQMSSGEFIGKRIEIVSDYDFVYMGTTGTPSSVENYMMPDATAAKSSGDYKAEIVKTYNFNNGTDGFTAHGDNSVQVQSDYVGRNGTKGLSVTNRGTNWHGAGIKLTDSNMKGRTVNVEFSASNHNYSTLEGTSVKCTLCYKSNSVKAEDKVNGICYSQIAVTGDFYGEGSKNWVTVSGSASIPADATDIEVYFETVAENTKTDFYIDDVTITFPTVGQEPTSLDAGKFIYAHTGRKIKIGTSDSYNGLYGYLTGDFTKTDSTYKDKEREFVYSGNDLTKDSRDKIIDFANRYKTDGVIPVIFGKGFFATDVMKSSTAVSAGIDRNSYVYELIPTDHSKALYESAILKVLVSASDKTAWKNQREMLETITRKIISTRVKLVKITDNDTYSGPSSLPADSAAFTSSGMSSSETFSIRIRVEDNTSSNYTVKFYIDNDFDGVLSDAELIEDFEVALVNSNGSLNRPVRNGKVVGNKEYQFSRKISGRFGAINWKMDVVNSANQVVSSIDGFYVIKQATGKANESLKILQIVPDSEDSHWTGITIKLPTESEVVSYFSGTGNGLGESTKKFIRGVYQKTGNGTYKSRIEGLDLKFSRMNAEEIMTASGAKSASGIDAKVEKVYSWFVANYKMLVPGFADCYKLSTDTTYANVISQAIVKFSNDGNAVLYTHDATSFVGNNPSTNPTISWAREITLATRASFGMDRYNVVEMKGNKTATRDDYPYTPLASGNTNKSSLVTNSVDSNLTLAQGYTNGNLTVMEKSTGNLTSDYVEIVNRGPITNYPYYIPDVINISQTHTQYYQLAFDRTDGAKINVWCTLAGDNNPATYTGTPTDNKGKYYQMTRRDTRNNYYIYNIGNITYTGVGHTKSALTDAEVMLFINTFVAAYRPASEPAGILVTNDDAVRSESGYYLCVDVDSDNVAGVIQNSDIVTSYHTTTLGEDITESGKKVGVKYTTPTTKNDVTCKRVKFEIEDNSTINAANAYYWVTATTNVNGTDVMLAIYKLVDGSPVFISSSADLKRNTEYYVDVPLKQENTSTKAITITDVKFTVNSIYKVSNKLKEAVYKDVNATIAPRGLFDLD